MEEFSIETNGYNRNEVNQFISDVIKETEIIIERCKLQSIEIDKLKSEIETYKTRENKIDELIIKTEKECDELRQNARNERDTIINDAKTNASSIVNDALIRAQKIDDSRELLETNIKIFKNKLKLLVEQQMDIVDEIDKLKLEE